MIANKRRIGKVSIVVLEYDEAIDWYTSKLDFQLIEDTPLDDQSKKRWVTIAPSADSSFQLLLAKASNTEQQAVIGNQTGRRVFLFLYTDNFERDYESFKSKGVEFVRLPKKHPYGTVAVFKDLYGNLWDLIEPQTAQ